MTIPNLTFKKQRGISMVIFIIVLIFLAIVLMGAMKIVPAYIEFAAIQKVISAMKAAGDTDKSVREIRASFDRRAQIDYFDAVKGDDLEIVKDGGEVVVTATYQKKIEMVFNMSACLDFVASTKTK